MLYRYAVVLHTSRSLHKRENRVQKISLFHQKISSNLVVMLFLTATLAGCGDGAVPTTTPPGSTSTVASLSIFASPPTVKSDNSSSTTITITAIDAGNAVVPNTLVLLNADTGALGAPNVTTDSTGRATVAFSSGETSKTNRTGSITATAGSATEILPVVISGSTLTLTTATTSISTGTAATLTATAKDAGGNPVSGQTVSFTILSGSGLLSTLTDVTDANGEATTDFTATAAGGASVKADWLDSPSGSSTASSTQTFTAATAGTAFGLITPATSPFAVTLGSTVTQSVTVYVPATILTAAVANVRFTTSLGGWQLTGTKAQTILFTVAGNYTATFVTGLYAGIANVQIDALDINGAILTSAQAVLSLSASAASATQISLQANVTSISASTGSTSSTATLTATVRDVGNNPVGNAPVLFELLNTSGTGEQVIPVTVMTAATAANGVAVGQAQSTFIAGTLPTTQASQVQASVIGASGVADTITMTVGGRAGSIAIGASSSISSINSDTSYELPVTLLVTDSNGVGVSGAVVTLSLWPIEYYKGVRGLLCAPIYDAAVFLNEDTNGNLILDGGEDVDGPGGHDAGAPFLGVLDIALWPQSSAAGTVPLTVTTGSNGTVTFNWIYLKEHAHWMYTRLRARTEVQGTEATTDYQTILPISVADSKTPCSLFPSPFN